MTNTGKALLGVGVVGLLAMVSVVGCAVGVKNDCVRSENGLEAQYQENQNNYATYFNKLKETAQVPQMYVADLQKVYNGAIQARYGADGSKAVWQFISEHNPNVDASLYKQVQQVIEAGRNDFEAEQKMLLDKRKVYQDMLGTFPSGAVAHMWGYPRVDLSKYNPVINDETEKAFNSKKAGPISIQ